MEVIPEGEAGPGRMDAALRQEVSALALAVTELSRRHDEAGQDGWQLVQTRASDLADGLKARLEGARVGDGLVSGGNRTVTFAGQVRE